MRRETTAGMDDRGCGGADRRQSDGRRDAHSALWCRIAEILLVEPDDAGYVRMLTVLCDATKSAGGMLAVLDAEGSRVEWLATDGVESKRKELPQPRETWPDSWRRALDERRCIVSGDHGSTIAAPILRYGEPIGILHLEGRAKGYGKTHESLATFVADHIAPVLCARRERAARNSAPAVDVEPSPGPADEIAFWDRIAEIFLTVPDDRMYAEVLDVVRRVLDSEYGIFGYLDEDETLVCPSVTNDVMARYLMEDRRLVFPRDAWFGLWGRALVEQRTLWSNTEFRVPEGHVPIHAVIAAPIVFRGETIGLLYIGNKPGGYDSTDERLLTAIAGRIAPILHARIERDRKDAALARSHELFRVALANSRVFAFTTDRNLMYTWVHNPPYALTDAAFVGKVMGSVAPSREFDALVAAAREVIASGNNARMELDIPYGGEHHAYDATLEPLRGADGAIVGLVGATVDISERKAMEDSLRESEERLAFHMNNTPLAVIEWDADMRLARWSGEAERIFGWTAEEVLGKRMEDFRWVYVEDKPQVDEVSDHLQDGTSPSRLSVNRNYRKDGTVVTCEWYNSSLVDEEGKFRSILSLVLDVTERKRMEEEIRRSEERFRVGLDTAKVTVFTLDRDLRFTWVYSSNTDSAELAREIVGMPSADYMKADMRDALIAIRRRVIETGIGSHDELVTTEGGWAVYEFSTEPLRDENGAAIGVIVASRDVTERKQLEEEVRASDERFRLALGNSHIAVFALDRDLRYTWTFNAAIRFSDVDPIGKRPDEIMPRAEAESIMAIRHRVLATGVGERHEEEHVIDGAVRTFDVTVEPQRDAAGDVVGIVAITVDITERKRAEEEIRGLARFPGENPNPILRVDRRGRIIYANPGALRLVPAWTEAGVLPAEIRGTAVSALAKGDARDIEVAVGNRIFAAIIVPFSDAGYANVYAAEITDRKKAEVELRRSEALLNVTQAMSRIGGWEWDVEKQTTYWTDEVYRIHEIDPAEVASGSPDAVARSAECYPPEARAVVLDAFRRCVEEGVPYDLELPFVTAKGRSLWIRTAAEPVKENGRIAKVVGNIMDITERKRMEDRLRKDAVLTRALLELHTEAPALDDRDLHNRFLDTAADLTDSAIGFFHRVSDDQKTIILTTWNNAARENCATSYDTHYPLDEAGNWVDCVREKRPVIYNDFPSAPNRKGLPEGHVPLRRILTIPVMEGEKVRIIFGVGNKPEDYDEGDVTRLRLIATELHKIMLRRQAEEALRTSEERFRRLFEDDLTGDFIATADGRIAVCNPAFARTYGFADREEALGANLADTFFGPAEWDGFIALLKDRKSLERHEDDRRRRDGAPIHVVENVIGTFDEAGELVQLQGYVFDDTERSRAVQGLRESEEKYRQLFTEMRSGFALHEIVCDKKGKPIDYRFIEANPAFEALTGLRVADVVGRTVREVIPEIEPSWIERYGRVALTGEPDAFEDYAAALDRYYEVRVFSPERGKFAVLFHDVTGRKRMEDEIRLNEQRLQVVLRNAHVSAAIVDRDLRYQWAFSPYPSLQDMVGKKTTDFFASAEAKVLDRIRRRVLETGVGERADYHAVIGGETRYFEINVDPLRDARDAVASVMTVSRDVSARHMMEEALRLNDERFRIALRDSSISVYSLDTDLRYTWVYNGHPLLAAEEIVGRRAGDSPIGPEIAAFTETKELVLSSGVGAHEEVRLAIGGEPLVLDVHMEPLHDGEGRVTGIIAASIDITARKRMEDDLRETSEYLENLIGYANAPIITWDPLGGITRFNRAFQQLTGYDESDVVGQNLWMLFPEDSREESLAKIARTSSGERWESVEIPIRRKDGAVRVALWNSANILAPDGTLVSTIAQGVDITERKRIEEDLARAMEEAERRATELAAIMEVVPMGICVADDPECRVIRANPALARMLEMKPRDNVSLSAPEPERPDYRAFDTAGRELPPEELPMQIAAKGVPVDAMEMEIVRADGSTINLLASTRPLTDEAGSLRGAVGAYLDITDRRLMEDAIRLSEERFRIALKNIPLTVSMQNRDLNYVWMHGPSAPHEGAPDHPPRTSDIDTDEEAARADAIKRRVFATGEGVRVELTGTINGAERAFDVTIEPLRNAAGEVDTVVTAAFEITERKKMEDALRASEERFRVAIDASEITLATLDHDLRYLWLHNPDRRVTGHDAYVGHHMSAVFSVPEDAIELEVVRRRILETGERDRRNYTFHTRDGGTQTYDIVNEPLRDSSGAIVGIIAATTNITDRIQMEEALRTSEERFRVALANAQITAFSQDMDMRYTWAYNPTSEASPESSVVGRTDEEIYVPEVAGQLVALKRRVIESGVGVREEVRVTIGGQEFYYDLTVEPLRDAFGEVDGVVGAAIDITERKRWEELIQELNADLRRRVTELRNLNRELEAFSYSVSHDLRAPLRSIDGFSLALLEDYNDLLDDTGKDYLARVRSASQRMAQLIDDMLTLSRVTRREITIQGVNLTEIARSMADDLTRRDKERQVEFAIADGVQVSGDRHLLITLMQNLLENAWKFTSRHATARIEFGVTEARGKRAYFVRDDGAGFDMSYANKLFGAFQRLHTDKEFEGTGIGLATVQRIVHQHGGEVWAEGAIEKGAAFYFTLGNEEQ